MPGDLTAVAVVAGAGARFDGAHPGLAHVAEHMLFPGTQRWDQGELNRLAAPLGGDVDAETGHDDMTLSIEVFNEDVEPALELLAELLFRSRIPADRFAKERHVIADEIRSRAEDPANVAYERSWAHFFDGPLGHPICGTLATLERMTAATVRRFVRRHLVPENMVLCVAGGVSTRTLQRALARSFPLPTAPRRPRPPTVRVRGAGHARFRRRDSSQAQLVRVAEAPVSGAAQLALALAVEVVGSDPDARLFQELRERLGLGYDVSAELEVGMGWAASLVAASAAKEDAGRLRDAVERVCREAAEGLGADEVARARRKVRHRLARLADSRLDRALTHATRALGGRPSVAASARMLERLSHAAVEEAWRRHLRAPTLTAVLSA
jgi:predicted Zn-dependent peptidase